MKNYINVFYFKKNCIFLFYKLILIKIKIMAVKKKELGKVVKKSVNGTFLDVRQVPTYSGHGKDKKITESTYAIFHEKKNIKDGFKNAQEAEKFVIEKFSKYNIKKKQFV
jgi:hypothetical protein